MTINAWVQLLVPPPKYHVQSLIDCDLTERAPIDSIILMERGPQPLAEEPGFPSRSSGLIDNTDDAYTFPPFAAFAPMIVFGELDYPALRARERESAPRRPWRMPGGSRPGRRAQLVGLIPSLVERHRAQLPPSELAAAAPGDDVPAAVEGAAADTAVVAGRVADPLGANLLAQEADVGEREQDHRQADEGHDLRPRQQQALVEREQRGDLLLGLVELADVAGTDSSCHRRIEQDDDASR